MPRFRISLIFHESPIMRVLIRLHIALTEFKLSTRPMKEKGLYASKIPDTTLVALIIVWSQINMWGGQFHLSQ